MRCRDVMVRHVYTDTNLTRCFFILVLMPLMGEGIWRIGAVGLYVDKLVIVSTFW